MRKTNTEVLRARRLKAERIRYGQRMYAKGKCDGILATRAQIVALIKKWALA